MKLKIKKLWEHSILPEFKHDGDAGMDCYACIKEQIAIEPHSRYLVPLGFSIELEKGYEAQIRPRSGLALKEGLSLANCVGTVDSNYRGEVCAIVLNTTNSIILINPFERICQMVIKKYEIPEIEIVDTLSDSDRGAKGFGSTGV